MDTDTQVITRGKLSQIFGTQSLALLAEQPAEALTPKVSTDLLVLLTAELLTWPMQSVKAKEQVGRFVLADYTPVMGGDPDILIVLENGPAAAAFNQVVRAFQDIRRDRVLEPGAWYVKAKEAASQFIKPLWGMQPTADEVAFVARWVLLTVAQGKRINDGVRARPVFGSPTPNNIEGLAPWSGWISSSGE